MKGLEKRYHVIKLENPSKNVDAIVLEFDDPTARLSIFGWAKDMMRFDEKLTYDVMAKLEIEEMEYINRIENTYHAETRLKFLELIREARSAYVQKAMQNGWPL